MLGQSEQIIAETKIELIWHIIMQGKCYDN
jgi:hypothetical protein